MKTVTCVLVVLFTGMGLLNIKSSADASNIPGVPGGKTNVQSISEPKGGDRQDHSRTIEYKKAALKQKIEESEATGFRKFYMNFLDEYSPYRSMVLTFITLLVLLVLKKYTTRMMRSYTDPRALKTENVERFLRTWNAVWKFVIGVFVVIALSGSLKLLGLSAAFLGMILGWSLQAPVTGIAAWLMIILKRPFNIGDRVIIAGVTGDVTDITLTHVILNQVGGTVGGEERSGRGVLIPNAILFAQVIMNYTLDAKTMLDEVPVRITFDSDYELAKKIMLEAANEVMSKVIRDTKEEPFIRTEFFEAGIIIRLRYQTIPSRRQEFSSLIVEKILEGIKAGFPAVKYCFPQSVVHYRWENESPASE